MTQEKERREKNADGVAVAVAVTATVVRIQHTEMPRSIHSDSEQYLGSHFHPNTM